MNDTYHITLLRHGESTGNAEGIYQGQLDLPLNNTGREQVRLLAHSWKEKQVCFDRIIASPLLRARETAEIIAAALDLPVDFDPDLMERNGGALQGLTIAEGAARFPTQAFQHPYQRVAGEGESEWDLFLRAGRAVNCLISRPPGRYLVVSHGAILNRLVYAMLGILPQAHFSGPRFRFENTGYAVLTYNPSSHNWTVESINKRDHLNCEEARDGIKAGFDPLQSRENPDENLLKTGNGHVD